MFQTLQSTSLLPQHEVNDPVSSFQIVEAACHNPVSCTERSHAWPTWVCLRRPHIR